MDGAGRWDVGKEEQLQKDSCYTSYLDRLFSRKDEGSGESAASAADTPEPEPSDVGGERERDEGGFLARSGEIMFNMQLDSLALPGFAATTDVPLKSIQASLAPSTVKCSPQIGHTTYSSFFKHLN